MLLLNWLRRLLGLGPAAGSEPRQSTRTRRPSRGQRAQQPRARAEAGPARPRRKGGQKRRSRPDDANSVQAPLPSTARASITDIAIQRAHERLNGIGNLDDESRLSVVLEGSDQDLMWNIERRIERGKFQLPQLPSTSMAAIEMTNAPSTDIADLSGLISADPLLCSELLKTANSVLYAAHIPAETLHEAIMRVGMRTLRSLIFSVSMRGVILKGHGLNEYAEEVWRQALSIGAISRAIAPELRMEPEKAFMIGLLQDIGKVALLTMLREEVRTRGEVNPALVGKIFHKYHERAGAAMGKTWRLPPEIASVAGCHHRWADNEDFKESAALASLAHQLDLYLSLGDTDRFYELAHSEILEYLEVPADTRGRILKLAHEAFDLAQEQHTTEKARSAGS